VSYQPVVDQALLLSQVLLLTSEKCHSFRNQSLLLHCFVAIISNMYGS